MQHVGTVPYSEKHTYTLFCSAYPPLTPSAISSNLHRERFCPLLYVVCMYFGSLHHLVSLCTEDKTSIYCLLLQKTPQHTKNKNPILQQTLCALDHVTILPRPSHMVTRASNARVSSPRSVRGFDIYVHRSSSLDAAKKTVPVGWLTAANLPLRMQLFCASSSATNRRWIALHSERVNWLPQDRTGPSGTFRVPVQRQEACSLVRKRHVWWFAECTRPEVCSCMFGFANSSSLACLLKNDRVQLHRADTSSVIAGATYQLAGTSKETLRSLTVRVQTRSAHIRVYSLVRRRTPSAAC